MSSLCHSTARCVRLPSLPKGGKRNPQADEWERGGSRGQYFRPGKASSTSTTSWNPLMGNHFPSLDLSFRVCKTSVRTACCLNALWLQRSGIRGSGVQSRTAHLSNSSRGLITSPRWVERQLKKPRIRQRRTKSCNDPIKLKTGSNFPFSGWTIIEGFEGALS